MADHLHSWIENGGVMGKRIYEKDWTQHPLGAIEDWPDALRNTIPMVVETKFPALICWGDELVMIYNDAYSRLVRDKPDALGRPFLEVWSEIKETIEPLVKEVFSGKTCFYEEVEFTILRFNQPEQAWFDFCYTPLRDGTGGIKGILILAIEKTEQLWHQQALSDSEKHLRLATKAADMHLCEIDLARETLKWTDEVEHNVTFPMPKTLKKARELLHPEDEDRVIKVLEEAIAQRRDFELEYRVVNPVTNQEVWVYSAGTPIIDTSVKNERVVAVTKNITKRKLVERREHFLTELNDKLHRIGDPDKLISVSAQMLCNYLKVDRCIYAKVMEDDNQLSMMVDYTRNGMPAMSQESFVSSLRPEILRLMHQRQSFVVSDVEEDSRITESDEKAYKQQQIESIICAPLHKDGQFVAKMVVHQQTPRRWSVNEVELVKTVANRCWEAIERIIANQELKKINKTLEDRVTNRTKALRTYQDQLRSLALELNRAEERERQNLAAELHNNLGQMLAISKIGLDSLEKEDLPEAVLDEIGKLKALANDAISYTRELMSELKPPPALEKENFTKVLKWKAKKMKKHGLDVSVEERGQPMHVSEKVRTTLRRCIRELLINIVKHAEVYEAGMTIAYHEKEVQITVEDSGKGFDMEEREPMPMQEGGFGLFNIQERMNWLGGRFEMTSASGKGTRASLYAPLEWNEPIIGSGENGEAVEAVSIRRPGQTELWQPIEVLLVDDHEMMRKGLRKLIEEQNDLKIIAEASDGEDAIKQIG